MALLAIGLVLSLAACAFFAVRWIDLAISYTYLEASFDQHVENSRLVSSLLQSEWSEMTHDEILHALRAEVERQKERQSLVVQVDSEQNVIWLNEVRFQFSGQKLRRIGD